MESASKYHAQDKLANKWNGVAFALFAALYAFYIHYLVFGVAITSLVNGIRISGIDTAFLLTAGMFYFGMFFVYIYAFVLLTILYLIKTEAKKLATAYIILPIVALHIARAVITSYHPVTIYP